MAFVEAKCTQCGGNIKVDDSKEAGICKHCGTAFITEKAINNYNITHNITNTVVQNTNIKANTVNVFQDELNKFFVVEQGTLVKYNGNLKKITIPEGILAIGEGLFENKDYSEIILPKSVTTISKNAFNTTTADIDYNDYSPKVIIPYDSNLIEIEDYAFYDNYTPVPRSVEKLGKVEGMIFYYGDEDEFKQKFPNHCTSPDWKKNILFNFKNLGEKDCFLYAESDTEVFIYDTKKTSSRTLTIYSQINNKKVTSINWKAFAKLFKNEYGSFTNAFDEVVFEEGLTEIGNFVWGSGNAPDFKYMYIPSTVEKIGTGCICGYNLNLVEIATNIDIPQNAYYKTENPSLFVRKLNKPGPKQFTATIINELNSPIKVVREAYFGAYCKEYDLASINASETKEIYVTPSKMSIVTENNTRYNFDENDCPCEIVITSHNGVHTIHKKGNNICIIKLIDFKNSPLKVTIGGENKALTQNFSFEFNSNFNNSIIIKGKPYTLPNNNCTIKVTKKFLGVNVEIE